MDASLKPELESETPQIILTVCLPASLGLALCSLVLGSKLLVAAVALVLAGIGMASPVLYQVKRSRNSRKNSKSFRRFLSQESGAMIIYWLFLLMWLMGEVGIQTAAAAGGDMNDPSGETAWGFLSLGGNLIVLVWGTVLLWIINRPRRFSSNPALIGPEGLMELVGIACGCGGALYALMAYLPAVAAGGWGGGGLGAVAPVSQAIPSVTAVLMAANCVLCAATHTFRRLRLVEMAQGNDQHALLTLKRHQELAEQQGFALNLSAAAASLSIVGLVMAFVPTFPWPLMLDWMAIAMLQITSSVLQRRLFCQLPAPVRNEASAL